MSLTDYSIANESVRGEESNNYKKNQPLTERDETIAELRQKISQLERQLGCVNQ